MDLNFPNRNGENAAEVIEVNQPIVIVGANGSGKSRLGFFIDRKNFQKARMISAQRSLGLPPQLPERWTLERSLAEFNKNKMQSPVQIMTDYQAILQILFAEEAKRDKAYVQESRAQDSNQKPPIPETPIDKIIEIWKELLPQREIEFADNKVEVKYNDSSYIGSDMSDGERVALYLLGQCLIAPANSILIIDEPELHLHKALMSALWNKVEAARPDCQFIYITHDLDFAASRTNAKKIWAKEYRGDNRWIWEEVPDIEEIPENLVLEIIGSRKPILFVEGDKGSYDYEIYQYVFPNFTIIPREGCAKVIESTKALRANKNLHTISAYGLIDRDYRSEEEIAALTKAGISFINVAEVENLLCSPNILRIVAENQALNPDEIVQKITTFVTDELKGEFDREISRRSAEEIGFRLNTLDQKAVGKENLKQAVADLVASIDIDQIYAKNTNLYQEIIDTNNLEKALKYYTNKGLINKIAKFFNLKSNDYADLIVRLLRTKKGSQIVDALKPYIPEIK
jgi:hypothetical protein